MTAAARRPVAELRRHPGTRRRFSEAVALPGLGITTCDRARRGRDRRRRRARGAPRRRRRHRDGDRAVGRGVPSLPRRRSTAPTVAEVAEIFEPRPVEGETYPLGRRPRRPRAHGPRRRPPGAAAGAAVLRRTASVPRPRRSPAVAAVDGAEEPEPRRAPSDPRWAALDDLHLDSAGRGRVASPLRVRGRRGADALGSSPLRAAASPHAPGRTMAVPKKKTSKSKSRSRRAVGLDARRRRRAAPARVAARSSSPTSCAGTAAGTTAARPSTSTDAQSP